MTTMTPTATTQLCTFEVDGLLCGVDVLHVQEVLRAQELTPVPLADAAVHGLINLRGHIVTALDLRRRLALPPRDPAAAPAMNVIVRADDGIYSLLVDDVGEVVDAPAAAFEPCPDTLPAAARALIAGIYQLPTRLLHVLDPRQVAQLETPKGLR